MLVSLEELVAVASSLDSIGRTGVWMRRLGGGRFGCGWSFERGSTHQMVPRTSLTNLDGIGHVGARPLCQPGEFASQRDAASVLRQAGTKYIGDMHKSVTCTYRAAARSPAADLSRRPHQLGVRIAYLAAVEDAIAVVGQNRSARQTVIDMAFGVAGVRRRDSKHSPSIVDRLWPPCLCDQQHLRCVD